MRAVLEALTVVAGALGLFKFLYGGFAKMRRAQRRDRIKEQREQDAWLDSQLSDSYRKGHS